MKRHKREKREEREKKEAIKVSNDIKSGLQDIWSMVKTIFVEPDKRGGGGALHLLRGVRGRGRVGVDAAGAGGYGGVGVGGRGSGAVGDAGELSELLREVESSQRRGRLAVEHDYNYGDRSGGWTE